MSDEKIITDQESGKRLDLVVEQCFALSSRSEAKGLIERHEILLNQKPAKPAKKVSTGDKLTRQHIAKQASTHLPINMPLNIIYEDADIIAINKAPGIAVHPSKGHGADTLLNGVLFHCKDLEGIGSVKQPGIIHRLDRDTSGIIVMAKNHKSHVHLKKQFEAHTTSKRYLAISQTPISETWQTIDVPLGPDATGSKRQKTGEGRLAKPATTRVRQIQTSRQFSLIECELLTGRTHQIRLHLAHIGSPIEGDALYHTPSPHISRQALHAKELSFIHPTSLQDIHLKAPLWPDMQTLLDQSS